MTYEFHPLANIFPLIDGKPYTDLMTDILKNGVMEPVWLYEGKILDGRNRYRAATAMRVECPVREYTGTDATGFVISLNLHRRHLNETQRATVAAKLANITNGGDRKSDQSANLPTDSISQAEAAKMVNVSTRSVTTAAKVLHDGSAELIGAMERGEVAVSAAAKVAELPKIEQAVIVSAGPAKVRETAKAARHAGKPKTGPKADAIREELKAAKERGTSMLCSYARLLLDAILASESLTEEERDLLMQIESAVSKLN